MRTILLTLGLFLAMSSGAHATKPCQPPSNEWFIENVAAKSNTVIYARILDDSADPTNNLASNDIAWTKVEVLENLLDGTPPAKQITIGGWQANNPPLFTYKKGDFLVLWLTHEADQYRPTDITWSQCVPSIWRATPEKMTYNPLTSQEISLDSLRQYATGARKPAPAPSAPL